MRKFTTNSKRKGYKVLNILFYFFIFIFLKLEKIYIQYNTEQKRYVYVNNLMSSSNKRNIKKKRS